MQCTATSKRSGEQCRRRATKGMTVCRMHGGVPNHGGGAPKGSKNALKTGLYETITRETMFDDEIAYANSISLDPIKTLEEQIRMLRVKERRLAMRMKKAMEAEREAGQDDGKGGKKPAIVLLSVSTVQTENYSGERSKSVTSNSETHSMFYLRLEAAHTSVLDQIRRAMDNLAKLKAETVDEENTPVSIEVQVVDASRHGVEADA